MPQRVTHQGTDWEVRIAWLRRASWRGPERKRREPRLGRDGREGGSGAWDLLYFLPGEGFLWLTIAIAAIAFLFFFGLPLLALLLEQLLLVLIAFLGAISRTLFRRPWSIEVTRAGQAEPSASFEVVGWRRARRARNQIARHITRTGQPPGTLARD